MYLGNNPEAALQVVSSLYENMPMRVIDDGYENLIIVVDETYIVRFPRSKEIWGNSQPERFVLEKLASHDSLPFPKLITASDDPAYVVLTYLHGSQPSIAELRGLPTETLQTMGKEIANIAYAFHRLIPINELQPLLTPPSWSYDDYLKRVLFDRRDQNPGIDTLAKKYYEMWLNKKTVKTVVVHDDLHLGNLLFNSAYHISGVLDFGAVCLGSPEQDLRQVYRLGNDALEAAATTYEDLSGKPFDREMAKLWTITQELGAYCREEAGPAHDRAAENLQFWFPELKD